MVTLTPLAAISLVAALAAGAPQGGHVPADTLIRLERTSCAGECPAYMVTVDAGGRVVYEGQRNVRAVGRHTARIAPSAVATLLASVDRMRFFELQDAYTHIKNPDGTFGVVSDLPTTIITVTLNGRTKRVVSYVGAPESVEELQREIDAAAGTKRWTFLDEPTLTALLRSGWRASSDEGARLLRQALRDDEVAIARMLIGAGADMNGPKDNQGPPLGGARSAAMVQLLLDAGANPNDRWPDRRTDQTALMATAHKDASVAEALIKAGARLEDTDHGLTALGFAACAGNWRVVAVLLKAGASPRGGSHKISALECARTSRQVALSRRRTVLDRGTPTVEDFDRVIALLERAGRGI